MTSARQKTTSSSQPSTPTSSPKPAAFDLETADFSDLEMRVTARMHDETLVEFMSPLADSMPRAAQAWQRALLEVLKVGAKFYANRDDAGRRAIEQRFNEMARGNPRRSHKAAVARKVVLARVRYALDESEPLPPSEQRMIHQGSVTGRWLGGPTSLDQLSKRFMSDAKRIGNKSHIAIIDELTALKKI